MDWKLSPIPNSFVHQVLIRIFSRVSRGWKSSLDGKGVDMKLSPIPSSFLSSDNKLFDKRHSLIFVPGIFKILKRYHFWASLRSPRVFVVRGNIFEWKVRGFETFSHTK